MSFPHYDFYKASGVDWLGVIPGHWDVVPLKRNIAFLTSGSRGWADHYSEDGAIFIRIGNLTRDRSSLDLRNVQRVAVPEGIEGERTKVEPGDILFSITAYLGSVAVVPESIGLAYVSQHVALVRLKRGVILPEWIAYLALSSVGKTYLEAQGYGGTKVQLSLEDISRLPIVCPPLSEQVAIVSFLDRETAKIDALVEEQQRLIDLLNEKRQATISRAISKGLNPLLANKTSGTAIYGPVPDTWVVLRLRFVVGKIESGTSVNSIDIPAPENAIGILKTSSVYSGEFDYTENKAVLDDEISRVSCPVKSGALIVSRMNTPDLVGAAGLSLYDRPNIYLPDRLWQVHIKGMSPEFVDYWTKSEIYRYQIKMACAGTSSSMQNISQDQFLNLYITRPPISEQNSIVQYLESTVAEIKALMDNATDAVALLQERRAALISAAVTGKIDVRDALTRNAEAA
ncbi:MAG: hypothetical protein F9K30_17640 [Dechloromonas sp.]|nr:MAG: hypothetical protein F9K30_17640 [Dechloromonas sp.]